MINLSWQSNDLFLTLFLTKESIESFPFTKFGATKCRLSKIIVTELPFYWERYPVFFYLLRGTDLVVQVAATPPSLLVFTMTLSRANSISDLKAFITNMLGV